MAYPPVLASVDIDPPAWFEFLEAFNKLIEVGTGVRAIQVGAAAMKFVPLPAARLVGRAGRFIADRAGASAAVADADTFLEDANQSFFHPRGLVAGVIRFTELSNSGPLPPMAELIYQEPSAGRALGKIESWMDKRAQDKFEDEVQMITPFNTSSGLVGGRSLSLLRGDRKQRSSQILAPPTPYTLPPIGPSSVEVAWECEEKKEKDIGQMKEPDMETDRREGEVKGGDLGDWTKGWAKREAGDRGKAREEPLKAAKKLKDYLYLYITVLSNETSY